MRVTAIYPGTFDPMTVGHTDVTARASRLFDEVIVAVGANSSKTPFFTLDERVEMGREIVADLDNVSVQPFDGLLVDFISKVNGKVIVRGLRGFSDFDYEVQIAGVNRPSQPPRTTLSCHRVLCERLPACKVMSVILYIRWYSMPLMPNLRATENNSHGLTDNRRMH